MDLLPDWKNRDGSARGHRASAHWSPLNNVNQRWRRLWPVRRRSSFLSATLCPDTPFLAHEEIVDPLRSGERPTAPARALFQSTRGSAP